MLLFVFWYCHKRGKEVRLERERQITEAEIAEMEAQHIVGGEPPHVGAITTAPVGAPIEEVHRGMLLNEAQEGQAIYASTGSLAKDLRQAEQFSEATSSSKPYSS